jgi:hypothetical protein
MRLGGGATLSYDRLVVTVGSTITAGAIERYDEAAMQVMPHAWMACGQTLTLRRQLESMPDGGLFVMAAPPDPFPCPPAPYERVSLIAAYFKQYKPRSKITVHDAKDTFAGQDLFQDAYCGLHRGTVHCECLGFETIELSPSVGYGGARRKRTVQRQKSLTRVISASPTPAEMTAYPTLTPRLSQWLPREMVGD